MSPVKKISTEEIGMNRDTIKYIAIIAMTCNHFAHVFLNSNTLLYEVLVDIGYFTAVTMCYFLVEGYHYTRDKQKYAQRLFIFGIISQIPYMLALSYKQFNMLLTLCICYQILQVLDSRRSENEKYAMVFLLSSVTVVSDWALMAPFFTIIFAKSRGDKRKTIRAFLISATAYGTINLLSIVMVYPVGEAVLRSVCSCIGILAAGIVIVDCYNGKQAVRGRSFSKWFFYIYYPLHLAVLWILKMNYYGKELEMML